MKILFLNQFYYPDSAATSQYLTDLTRTLRPQQWATVICGGADYAVPTSGEIENLEPPPVYISQVKNSCFGRSKAQRVKSYFVFLLRAHLRALTMRPEIVVSMTTPPFLSLAGLMLKKVRGSRHFIWEMDLYPELVSDLGHLKKFPPAHWFLTHLARYIRRNADGIITLGECMKERLVKSGIQPHKIHVAPNWADGEAIKPQRFPETGGIIVHYSGNFGLVHDYATITGVIEKSAADPRFHFIFAGGGRRRADLETWCQAKSVHHVEFQPYCSREQLSANLAQGHIGLVLQRTETLGDVVPSKTYGIMAAGRPILYIGPATSEPARVIDRFGCGWRFEPGDIAGVTNFLQKAAQNRAMLVEAGRKGRLAFEQHYDRPLGVHRVASIIGLTVPHPAQQAERASRPAEVIETGMPSLSGG